MNTDKPQPLSIIWFILLMGGFGCLFIPVVGAQSDTDAEQEKRSLPEGINIGEQVKEEPVKNLPPLDAWPRWRSWDQPSIDTLNWNRSRTTLPPMYRHSPPGFKEIPSIQRYADAIFVSILLGIFIAYIIGRIVVSGNPARLMTDGISLDEHRMALTKAAAMVMIPFLISVAVVIGFGYQFQQFLYPVTFQTIRFDLLWILGPGVGLVFGTWLGRTVYRHSIQNALRNHL